MSKAEDRAQAVYPAWRNGLWDEFNSSSAYCGFIKGYHQAEKELIEKAIGWIKEINNHYHIMRYSDSCEPPISELTEWFKNYMKEGSEDE